MISISLANVSLVLGARTIFTDLFWEVQHDQKIGLIGPNGAGKYLFSYRQTAQRVGELSGGERSRLQLALVVLSKANFLLLDEPTNNLDIASAEVLEDALAEFEGTALIISHDRYFLDQVVDRILVVEDGQVLSHPGGYSDYINPVRSKGKG